MSYIVDTTFYHGSGLSWNCTFNGTIMFNVCRYCIFTRYGRFYILVAYTMCIMIFSFNSAVFIIAKLKRMSRQSLLSHSPFNHLHPHLSYTLCLYEYIKSTAETDDGGRDHTPSLQHSRWCSQPNNFTTQSDSRGQLNPWPYNINIIF